jgi:hypothetical protein
MVIEYYAENKVNSIGITFLSINLRLEVLKSKTL